MSGFVYVLLADSGKVKVGFSANPERRAKQINQGLNETARLIWTYPATRLMEERLHQMFQPARVKGKWYSSMEALYPLVTHKVQEIEARERGVLDPRGIA